MTTYRPDTGTPGTTDQKPRWEGPEETRPRGYLPAEDDPTKNPDAAGETLEPRHAEGAEATAAMHADGSAGEFPPFEHVTHPASQGGHPTSHPQAGNDTDPAPHGALYEGHPEFSQDAAANKPPRGIGNSESVDDVDAKTRHSDGVEPSYPSRRDA
jgi:hypothetical protein